MAKQETLDLALVLLDEFKAATGADRTFGFREVQDAYKAAHDLTLVAARLQAIAVRICNGHQTFKGEWDEVAAKADERAQERLYGKANALATPYAVRLTLGGDPRGCVVKVQTPHSGRYNGMGGREDGWGVIVP